MLCLFAVVFAVMCCYGVGVLVLCVVHCVVWYRAHVVRCGPLCDGVRLAWMGKRCFGCF